MAVIGRDALVSEISKKLYCTQAIVRKVLCEAEGIITDTMARGDKVQLTGFGTFELKHCAARLGRNPKRPEETYEVPAKDIPSFKAGKLLLAKVANIRNAAKKVKKAKNK